MSCCFPLARPVGKSKGKSALAEGSAGGSDSRQVEEQREGRRGEAEDGWRSGCG